ncbi:alpha-amylase chloroplastic [Micractinium conductrix]|uniref:alpha-amylase n=1 Tax=Micractinium conductrix TaxID=554055 RepID=A0A2P6VAT4_9CHLO|nr:alpha-amylase chloroplastic [Micractinium conductrix]|eukprot:PSC71161.1 alpha-amylase chloroplastic [Micractinium conductrix]
MAVGGASEPGLLDLPTYTLAILLFFFLLTSTLFERFTHWLIFYLEKRKRNGLAQAVSNLVLELTLVGFVSLLLIALQDPISSICVPYSPGPVATWNLIGNVRGCDCCLANTATIGECFLESRDCGPKLCNCDAQDPACTASPPSLEDLLAEWEGDASCSASAACATGKYLERVTKTEEVTNAAKSLKLECQDLLQLDSLKCPEGKVPLVSITALHQLHIFIFCVALTHVGMGVIMVLLASWRVHLWRRACADEDDQHARAVRGVLEPQANSGEPGGPSARLRRHFTSFTRPVIHLRSSMFPEQRPAARHSMPAMRPVPPTINEGNQQGGSLAIDVQLAAGGAAALPVGASASKRGGSGSSGKAGPGGSEPKSSVEGSTSAPPALDYESSGSLEDPSQLNALAPTATLRLGHRVLPDAVTAGPLPDSKRPQLGSGKRGKGGAFLARSTTLAREDYGGRATEHLICLLHQLNPLPVSGEDIRLMRASFMLTHRVPAGFDFWRYVSDSMEDDFAHIVGVSQEMWLTMVVFVLISGPLGWATTMFTALAALVLVVINAKLQGIIRHVCRGCRTNQLSSNVFWFSKPSLLLHPIKFTLFLCAFNVGSALFFLWSFGGASCPFTSHGESFYFALVVPWWAMLLFTGLIFADASVRTLPLYSLAVQMGSDFKHHMLPRGIKEKLLLAAQRIKVKHKAQMAAEEGSWHGGMFGAVTRSMRGGKAAGAAQGDAPGDCQPSARDGGGEGSAVVGGHDSAYGVGQGIRRLSLRAHAKSGNAVEEASSATAGAAAAGATLEAARHAAELSLGAYEYAKAEEPEAKGDVLTSLRGRLEAVARALSEANEEQYVALVASGERPAAMAHPRGGPGSLLQLPVDTLVRELRQQHAANPPPPAVQQNIVPMPSFRPLSKGPLEKETIRPEGTGEEVLLQGFNWDSWKQHGGWFNHVKARAAEVAGLGFTAVWLPPFTQSVSNEGYMPGDLYNLNSKYGKEEELIACVRELQSVGIKVLGDAVLNHRCAQVQDENGVWNKYGGKMAWDQRAIVGDDPNFRGRGNRSSGDIFSAAPNIDHSQEFVKRDLQEWLAWLRLHVGFDGWRLDFVKGFHGSHVKDYMEASVPQFAVGEYWDALTYDWDGTPTHNQDAHRQRTVNWINAAGGLATAFDITTKGILHAVFERCEYWRLKDGAGKPPGLMGWWPSRAVTFLENHDTGSSQGHWRFPGHAVEQGYAYIITHPGTPCVFWDHLLDQRQKDCVARLIAIRQRAGIHCRSAVKILRAERDVYAAEIEGHKGRLLMKIGPGDFQAKGDEWAIADCGHNWGVWEAPLKPAVAAPAAPATPAAAAAQ